MNVRAEVLSLSGMLLGTDIFNAFLCGTGVITDSEGTAQPVPAMNLASVSSIQLDLNWCRV